MKKLSLIVCTGVAAASLTCAEAGSLFGTHKPGNKVRMADLPPAAQATLKKNLNGGRIAEIDKETKNGAISYKAEVKAGDGKFYKVHVADDGKLLEIKEDKKPKHRHLPLFG